MNNYLINKVNVKNIIWNKTNKSQNFFYNMILFIHSPLVLIRDNSSGRTYCRHSEMWAPK